MIQSCGFRLTEAEAMALRTLVHRGWLAAAPNAWGTFAALRLLALLGLASQCGRLFHPTGRADRVCASLPPINGELFGGGA